MTPALREAWTAVDLLPSIDAKVQKQFSHDVEASCPLFITEGSERCPIELRKVLKNSRAPVFRTTAITEDRRA